MLVAFLPDSPTLTCAEVDGWECTEEDAARLAYNGMCAEDTVAVFELPGTRFNPRCMRIQALEAGWSFLDDSTHEETDGCVIAANTENDVEEYDPVLVRPKGDGAVRLVIEQAELEYNPQSGSMECPLTCDP